MTRYLLDTNHAGALLRGNSPLTAKMAASSDSEFSLCLPSIGELWHMIFKSTQVAANKLKLEAILERFLIYEFDRFAAREFGRILTELRQVGRPIPAIDVQIAAIAIVNDCMLLTADRHFDNVSGLRHENWA